MILKNKAFGLLGLCARAGRMVSGEFMTEKTIKENKAYLVIVAVDASDNTKKLFNDKCSFYHVPIREYGTKEELGKAIGKEMRASIAICDQGFAGQIVKHIDSSLESLVQGGN